MVICLRLSLYAQKRQVPLSDTSATGVRFLSGLHWQQVVAKAKSENKYIFLDCYTTWCGPCKKMDMEVYPVQQVGDTVNTYFIAVKEQMNRTKKDNEGIQNSYPDADYISQHYKITVYPTYLFFTPDGRLLDKSIGFMDVNGFLKLLIGVINPKTNYYVLLNSYIQGKRNMADMIYLAEKASLLGDTLQLKEILKLYYADLNKKDWLKKENVIALRRFTSTSHEIGFSIFYKNADSIDKIMEDADHNYAEGMITAIIQHEMINPLIVKAVGAYDTIPNWSAMLSKIKQKYNPYYAERSVIAARSTWAGKHKDWVEWSKYYILYEQKYGPKTATGQWIAFHLNNCAWAVFQHSDDKNALQTALSWSSRAVMMDPIPNWMDTYANILYKLGKNDVAIKWEKLAVQGEPQNMDFQKAIEKMKKGESLGSGN